MNGLRPAVRQLFLPNGLALLGATLLLSWKPPSLFAPPTGHFIALTLFCSVIVLAWRFRSPRVLLMVLLSLVVECTLLLLRNSSWAAANLHGIRDAITFLFPLNVAALFLIDEMIFDLPAFGWWAAMLAVQIAVVPLLFRPGQGFIPDWVRRPLISSVPLRMVVPQISALLFLAVGFALLGTFWVSRKPRDSGLFWALWACFLGLASVKQALVTAWFAVAALLLGVAVIETSYLIAYHDELTGLPARRAFNQTVSLLRGEYTIAMVDVDHFKMFNDTFGHDIGDQVLRMVASRMAGVGGDAKPFRYGGEEFAVVFPGRRLEEVLMQAEALRRAIAESTFVVRGMDRSRRPRKERRSGQSMDGLRRKRSDTRITVSIGLAEPEPPGMAVEDVIRAADKALYRAKERGRNRVEIAKAQHGRMRSGV
jgi:diguanylate cyclase (GGDEF)-like protein